MAKRRNQKKQEETIVDITDVKVKAQSFIEKNQIAVMGGAAVLVLLFGGYLAFQFLYQKPREKAAVEQMFKAEYQFQQDSFALALENPGGGYDGFLDIIDKYSGTKASNLAKYYAGICYLNLNRFEDAIQYLGSHNSKCHVTCITAPGALGDAYSELGQISKALSSYEEAASCDNSLLTPYYLNKLGLLNQREGNKDAARKAFTQIKEKYPESTEAEEVDKYIAMLK